MPLFLTCQDYDTAMLLLRLGANPRQKFQVKNVGFSNALEYLMKHNTKAAEAILDQGLKVERNGNLVVQFDLFKQDESGTSQNNSLIDICGEKASLGWAKESKILLHPLIHLFFGLKFRSINRPFYILDILAHIVIPIIITLAGSAYVEITSCAMVGNSTSHYTSITHWALPNVDSIEVNNSKMFSFDENDNSSIHDFICRKGFIIFTYPNASHVKNKTIKNDLTHLWMTSWLFISTGIIALFYIIKEAIEFFRRGCYFYFALHENCFSVVLMIMAIAFMICSVYYSQYAGIIVGWLILFLWIEFFVYMGNFHTHIGDFAFMSTYVAWQAVLCLITHVPIFLGFTFGFDIMNRNDTILNTNYGHSFGSTFSTFVHTISMMFEPNYEDHFTYDKISENGGHVLNAQLMALAFLLGVPLIVANILIAVSVSETDLEGLKERSQMMRTQRQINFLLCLKTNRLVRPIEFKVSKQRLKKNKKCMLISLF